MVGDARDLVIPYSFDTNDMHYQHTQRFRGTDFADYVVAAYDWLVREAATAPKMMSIGFHLRMIGRPGRIGAGEDPQPYHKERRSMGRAAHRYCALLARAIFRSSAVSPKRILLVNPNISGLVTTIFAREARVVAGQRAEILALSPSFGSASIECVAEIAIAAHGVLETIAAHPDYDAAVIAAFGEPGLEAAREIASMPVFGLGEVGRSSRGRSWATLCDHHDRSATAINNRANGWNAWRVRPARGAALSGSKRSRRSA